MNTKMGRHVESYGDLERLVNEDPHALVTPAEAARALLVDPKTVGRWHKAGKVRAIRTIGGHRRLYAADLLGEKKKEDR